MSKTPKATGSPQKKKKEQRPRSKKKRAETDPRSYIKNFFNKYPEFNYDPSRPVMDEFCRMCDMFWPSRSDRDNPERTDAREGIRDALVQQFNVIYGKNEKSLSAWQNLCDVLQLADVPNDLNACREVSLYFVLLI
ncbi:hypothetical protein FRC09_006353 [Ceratobasidium sp. 395]|nr:hypothetical protein FRC09_006353 [Ceratobasidium sp. 395]